MRASRVVVLAPEHPSGDALVRALGALPGWSVTRVSPDALTEAVLDGSDALLAVAGSPAEARHLRAALAEIPERACPSVTWVLDEGEAALEALPEDGLDDFLQAPLRPTTLRARLERARRRTDQRREFTRSAAGARVTLELTHVLASALEFREIVSTLVRRLAETLQIDRVSIVLSQEDSPTRGRVIAASDDQELTNLPLDLAKYPEILQALRSLRPVSIDDVRSHPVMDGVKGDVPEELSALYLFPLLFQKTALGVLFLRTRAGRQLSRHELDFCGAIANATAVALRNARVLQRLRREHHSEVTQAHSEAEARVQALRAYQDLFAAAPDGIAVFAPGAGLQFANPKAYAVLGYAPEELAGKTLYDLLTRGGDELRTLWESLHRESRNGEVDLIARHRAGHEITLHASFSVLEGDSVLVQFRDVTEVRATAAELRKTKEFLESLINASVDAIVAADLSGTLILFNKGAERIYGWRAQDVIGHLHVSRLYPEGVAQEVMRKIRCPEFGGVGRLQSMHSCAVDEHGDLIPISLSAAMIYENGVPVATVGVFTDLREKILAEERLAQAQRKLEVTEKQALLAELAGTAAHELNQPLTSVMGYGELLSRKLPAGSPEHNAAQVIVRETERMADLVRKIGRITRYETKSYVGDQRILDLEKASDEDP